MFSKIQLKSVLPVKPLFNDQKRFKKVCSRKYSQICPNSHLTLTVKNCLWRYVLKDSVKSVLPVKPVFNDQKLTTKECSKRLSQICAHSHLPLWWKRHGTVCFCPSAAHSLLKCNLFSMATCLLWPMIFGSLGDCLRQLCNKENTS
jgi:hypothetical protein